MSKAGWASCEITPPLGLPMGGRGPRFAMGTEVLDPLEAGATVLEDDKGKRAVVISLDLVTTGRRQITDICYRVAAVTGANPDAVIVNVSHTHAGPMMNFEGYSSLKSKPAGLIKYEENLLDKIAQIAAKAANNLKEVDIYWCDGTSNIGINRRGIVNGETVMVPNPDGFYHNHLWVLEICPTDGSAGCILFSHACHPVIVYSYAWTGISSEWPGRCRKFVKESLGENTHVQFMQGLTGNVRPRILSDFENHKFRAGTPEDVETTGREIAGDILAALQKSAEPFSLNLKARRGWFMADRATPESREHWEQIAQDDSQPEHVHELAVYWASRSEEPPNLKQAWPIGLVHFDANHALVYVAGEPFGEWYAVFQEAIPDTKLVACGYTHGGAGYLPTDAQLAEGGYEVTRSAPYSKKGPGALQSGLNQAVIDALQDLNR